MLRQYRIKMKNQDVRAPNTIQIKIKWDRYPQKNPLNKALIMQIRKFSVRTDTI